MSNGYPAPGDHVEPHPISELIPLMTDEELAKLTADIQANGLREDIVLLDGKILDGRHRYLACVDTKTKPRFRFFDPHQDGQSPVAFVVSHNVRRRHLTQAQAATVAADAVQMFEADAAARKRATQFRAGQQAQRVLDAAKVPAGKNANNSGLAGGLSGPGAPLNTETQETFADEFDQRTPGSESEGHETPRAKRERKGRATQQAAQAAGVSTRSVEEAKALKKKAPKEFEAVKSGKKSLAKAKRDAALAATEVQDALGRIGQICGAGLAGAARDGSRLKTTAEILAFAALSDDEMLRCRGAIESGWTVKQATAYKAQPIGRTHSVGELVKRAQVQGGMFNLEIGEFIVSVTRRDSREVALLEQFKTFARMVLADNTEPQDIHEEARRLLGYP